MKIKPIREKRIRWYNNKKFLTSMIGLFIIFIMIASALNLWKGEENTNEKYNGFYFVKLDNGWVTYVSNDAIQFSYSPKELEDIYVPMFNLNNKIYVMYDPKNMKENDYLIERLLGMLRYKGFSAFLACDKEEGCGNVPILNCTAPNTLFYFKEENTTKVYNDNNCITISGTREDNIKQVDRLGYIILGIMKE